MKLLYPLALLALIAIPILILIYILKNKYKEERHPSTYIWEVSEKFVKRKNPLQNFEHLISLIVQIIAIATLSLALAHPQFIIPGGANNIVFVLDASGSMNIKHNEETRFNLAKEQIATIAENANNGSTFTLIVAEKTARVVCEQVDDVTRFEMYLDTVESTYSTSDLNAAMTEAQTYYSSNKADLCYVATDKIVEEHENVELIDVSYATVEKTTDDEGHETKTYTSNDKNYGLSDFTYVLSKRKLTVSGTIYAYDYSADAEDATTLNITITINDEDEYEYVVNLPTNVPTQWKAIDKDNNPITFTDDVDSLESIEISISEEDLEGDCLDIDNTYQIFESTTSTKPNVLVVSPSSDSGQSWYIQAALKSLKSSNVTYVSQSSYREGRYDIYVFDGWTPRTLPEEGSLWFFGVGESLEDDSCGMVFNREYDKSKVQDASGLYGIAASYSNNTDSLIYNQMTTNIKGDDVRISKYNKYQLNVNFTTILDYNNTPLIFVGKNDNNQREVVFAFDLHDSDLPLSYDFLALMNNALNYSNPPVLSKFNYTVDDSMTVTIPDDVERVGIKAPSGKTTYIESTEDMKNYTISEVGNYVVTAYYEDGDEKDFPVYSSISINEGNPLTFTNSDEIVELVKPDNFKVGDGLWDHLLPFIIAAAVFFIADWGLYTHEQY